MTHLLYVAAGGAAGAVLRYGLSAFITQQTGHGFAYGTLAVNVIGSLLMGLLIGVLARADMPGGPLHMLLAVGLLGGFTTFSTFSLDTVNMLQRGETLQAGVYIGASVLLSIGALIAGLWAVRQI